jgi:hypothetical protein
MTTDEVVAAARLRLLLDERLGRETPVEVIRLAGVAPTPQLTVVVDLAEFDRSAQETLRKYAEQGLVSWLLRIGLEAVESVAAMEEVGRLLLAELGPADLLSRLGADEFVALVARNPKDGVGGPDVAERLRRVVAAHPWAAPVRISVGVAPAPADQPLSDVRLQADRALARARSAGGDRVVPVVTPASSRFQVSQGWTIPSHRKRP